MPDRIDQIQDTIVVWRIVDGKVGHELQTAGLIQALRQLRPVESYDIQSLGCFPALFQWALRCFHPGRNLPKPALIVAAGHGTHLSLLAARRAYGGQAVVLMKPSLPLVLFDLCLIPEHDRPANRSNVVKTHGMLNSVVPAESPAMDRGLFLIGGPSRHHEWDEAHILEQIRSIVAARAEVKWILTTSRRTPFTTGKALKSLKVPNLEVVSFAETELGWVAEQLKECGLVWVSEDSVSMVFEALTSGARVGLLTIPSKSRVSRVLRGVEAICDQGYVIRYCPEAADLRTWERGSVPSFGEADRCADIVLDLVCCEPHAL